jgi:hypothetical protein
LILLANELKAEDSLQNSLHCHTPPLASSGTLGNERIRNCQNLFRTSPLRPRPAPATKNALHGLIRQQDQDWGNRPVATTETVVATSSYGCLSRPNAC